MSFNIAPEYLTMAVVRSYALLYHFSPFNMKQQFQATQKPEEILQVYNMLYMLLKLSLLLLDKTKLKIY